MPICKICGKKLVYVNWRHLKTHGLTSAEYREQFPDAQVVDSDWSDPEEMSRRGKLAWDDPDFVSRQGDLGRKRWEDTAYREKITQSIRDRCANPEYREKMAKCAKMSWEGDLREQQIQARKDWWANPDNHSMMCRKMREYCNDSSVRQRLSEQAKDAWEQVGYRERMSEMMIHLWRDDSYRAKQMESHRVIWDDPQYRSKMSRTLGKKWSDIDFRREQMERRARLGAFDSPTDIEVILYNILDDLGVVYQKQVAIDHYIVDAFVENWLVIEAFGDYWHNYPDGKEKDRERASDLRGLGFQVLSIWGHELKNDPSYWADRISYMVDCT